MGVVSVSMPEGLVEQIDELVEKHNYSGRSEVVRDASRKLVEEFTDKQLEGTELAAVISALYPYDSADIETGLTELRHEHSDLIQSNSHSCLGDDDGCLETFVLEGTLEEVSTFVRAVETVSEKIRIDHTLYQIEHIGEERIHLEP